MAKKRTMDELRQTKDTFYNVPTHDPQTGELNPHFKDLTGERNPWALYGAPKIGSSGMVESETDDEAEVDDESNSYYEFVKKLKDLRKQYPNDQEFGKRVAMIIR